MKIAVILLTLLLLNSIVGAEEAPTPPAPGLTIGAFGGPVFRFVNLKDEIRTQAGGRAALIFNHRFAFGFGAYGLLSKVDAGEIPLTGVDPSLPLKLTAGHLGCEFHYFHNPEKVFHPSARLLVGSGNAVIKGDNEQEETIFSDKYLILAPMLNGEMNITPFVNLSVGAGYRFISGLKDNDWIEPSDLGGLSLEIALHIGAF